MSHAAQRAYDQDERSTPYEPEARWIETDGIGGFWSPLYDSGWILAPPPPEGNSVERVREAFRTVAGTEASGELEWKCFSWDGDTPWYADAVLREAGFVAGPDEAILAADSQAIAAGFRESGPTTVAVRIASDHDSNAAEEILVAADSVHRAVWGAEHPPTAIARGYWNSGGVCSIHVAYLGNQPVAYGRFQATPGSRFGGLWGGATNPAARNRGCYRTLIVSRAQEAIRRDLPWLMVDAKPETSLPILLHNGFTEIGRSRPYTYAFRTG